MAGDLLKLLVIIWMAATSFFMYELWLDMDYMSGLVHAYIQMVVEYAKH